MTSRPTTMGALVAEPVYKAAAGVGEDEVGGEESDWTRMGFFVGKLEDGFEVRDDDVVERGEEADHEEEGGGDGHGAAIGAHGGVVVTGDGCGGFYGNSHAMWIQSYFADATLACGPCYRMGGACGQRGRNRMEERPGKAADWECS